MKMPLLYILLTFVTCLAFSAEPSKAVTPQSPSCVDVDLRSEMGPVRSQGDIGWCYANAAADLVSFKFRKEWKGYQASAIFIALNYNFNQHSGEPGFNIFRDGGSVRRALSYAGEVGYSCPRELDGIFVNGGINGPITKKLQLAQELKKLFDDRTKSEAHLKAYYDFLKISRDQKSILSYISDPELEQALKYNLNMAVPAIAQTVCRPYRLPMPQLRNMIRQYVDEPTDFFDDVEKKWYRNQKADMFKYLNRQLDAKNVVAIDYKIKMISSNLMDPDLHASVIVGRKSVKGQCHYLIRNSWGPNCTQSFDGKVYSKYNKNVTCIEGEGNLWVSEAHLKTYLEGLVYFM